MPGAPWTFWGYRVYRLDQWDRESLLPPATRWQQLASFAVDTTLGAQPLSDILDSSVQSDSIAYERPHYPVGRYRFTDARVLNGFDYHYVVTCTTRAPRPGEVPDVSYHFLTEEEFHALRDADELLEANEVHGNWYGTPRREVAKALAAGRDVILKIDVQGARTVKERVPEALLIFIVPPSLEALFQRLRSRATETADELELRQRNAAIELARQGDYDQVVVNETGEVDRTAADIQAIIAQEKRRNSDRRIRIT